MDVFGRSTVSEFVGDRIVYRNLEALDARLPRLAEVRQQAGLEQGPVPRKQDPVYPQVIVHLLQAARRLDAPEATIQRLVYLGDTRLADASAFLSLCKAGGWPGVGFIGSESSGPAVTEVSQMDDQVWLVVSNRWSAVRELEKVCAEHGLALDAGTALVIDMDKTAIGARGRNAQVIDQARVDAVQDTVAGALGDAFDPTEFRKIYDLLNQPEFHPFTADNQDYLAYICLVLGSGMFELDDLVASVRSGQMRSFDQFIREVDARQDDLLPALMPLHQEIFKSVQAGDPTPFKRFRRNEYLSTVGRMGELDDGLAVEQLLKGEIVITAEVRALALEWGGRGVLTFCLSDKPDEASIPTPELAGKGYLPIHRTETHVVGSD
jgi:hypothetical protein